MEVPADVASSVAPAPAPPAPALPPPPRTVAGPWDVFWGVVIIMAINVGVMVPLILTKVIDAEGADFGLRWMPVDAVITLAVAWWLGCRKYGRSLRAGWSYAPVRARLVALGALLGLVSAAGVMLLPGGSDKMPMQQMLNALVARPAGGLLMLAIAVIAAVMEETYYRGFIFPALADGWGRRTAIAVVTIWFAVVHLPQLGWHWLSIAAIAGVSLIVTLLRAFTGSTLPGLATHVVYNFCLTAPLAIASLARLLRHG